MELSFSALRTKEVVNTQDGKKLGRTCDLVFCYPDNKVVGIVIPAGRGMFKKDEIFIAIKSIVRIGEDVILVNLPVQPAGCPAKGNSGNGSCAPACGQGGGDRRSFEEYE